MNQGGYALITGASGGIGECFARALAARKQNLVLAARSKDKLETLETELRSQHGIEAEVIDLDLSKPGSAQHLVTDLAQLKLPIELLINNAGFGAQGEFWKLPMERHAQMLQLNVVTLVELTYRLLPAMVERRRGAVINVASTAAFQPVPYTSVYAATKAFVLSFSMALAEESRPYGIRVVTLCPGGTRTEFFRAGQYQRHDMPGGLQPPEEVVAQALKKLDRGGGLVVPRLVNKLSIASERLATRGMVTRMAGRLFKP